MEFHVNDSVEIIKPMSWAYISGGVHKIKSKNTIKLNNGYYYWYGIVLETIYGDSRIKYFVSEDLRLASEIITPINIEEIT